MKKRIKEGFTEEGTPDLKYYAFDWDDNIVYMPTQIMLVTVDGDKVGMSTQDFATYRTKIGKEEVKYKDKIIAGFDENSFANFKVQGDKIFLIEAMMAKTGPAWGDFLECINNGSIFAIITARGHNPKTLKEAVYNYIVTGFGGIDKDELIKNLVKFRDFMDEENLSDKELIRSYLDLCKFHPVSYGQSAEANPEEEKIKALQSFVDYVKNMSIKLQKKAYFKNKIMNYFIPKIGFSDDDIRNVEAIKKHFEKQPDNIVQTYSTATGKKEKT